MPRASAPSPCRVTLVLSAGLLCGLVAILPTGARAETPAPAAIATVAAGSPGTAPAVEKPMTMETFLDRVMMAESGGRADLRSSRSTAVGAYQLIEGTFHGIVRRHFAAETASLTPAQLLALRTNPVFSRRVAEAFTRENATHLASQQLEPTFQNLRLAYLVGPGGAVRVLKAGLDSPLFHLLSPAAILANPFMSGMTARGLIAKAARDLAVPVSNRAGIQAAAGGPNGQVRPAGPPIRCNLGLPSCRRWVALHQGSGARAATRLAKR